MYVQSLPDRLVPRYGCSNNDRFDHVDASIPRCPLIFTDDHGFIAEARLADNEPNDYRSGQRKEQSYVKPGWSRKDARKLGIDGKNSWKVETRECPGAIHEVPQDVRGDVVESAG